MAVGTGVVALVTDRAFPATKVACALMFALRRLTTFRWAGPGVFGAASEKKQWAMSGVPPSSWPMTWPSPCRPRSQTVAVSLVPPWMNREALTSSSLIRGSSSSHRTSGSRLARSATSRTGAVNTTRAMPPRSRLSVGCTSTAPACSSSPTTSGIEPPSKSDATMGTLPGSSASCSATGPSILYSGR